MAGVFSAFAPVLHPMMALYFFLMECLFYFAASNISILVISAFCLFLAVVLRVAGDPISRRFGASGKIAVGITWGFLFLLALFAGLYVIAFAFLSQKIYFLLK